MCRSHNFSRSSLFTTQKKVFTGRGLFATSRTLESLLSSACLTKGIMTVAINLAHSWKVHWCLRIYLQDNELRMSKLVDKLKSRTDVIAQGGGDKAVTRHTSRGKWRLSKQKNIVLWRCFRKIVCPRPDTKITWSWIFIPWVVAACRIQTLWRWKCSRGRNHHRHRKSERVRAAGCVRWLRKTCMKCNFL